MHGAYDGEGKQHCADVFFMDVFYLCLLLMSFTKVFYLCILLMCLIDVFYWCI